MGATSGIGLAIARGLARAGADVAATGRRQELVDAAADSIVALGRRTLRVASDVTNPKSLEGLCDACIEQFGRVDILVNAAGITARAPSLEMPESRWQEIMETNFTGTLRACRLFGGAMVERGYGRIVNIGSLTSVVALYEVAAYAASKAAVASLTKSLAVEWTMSLALRCSWRRNRRDSSPGSCWR